MFNFEWFDKSIGVATVSIGSYGITFNTAVLNMFPKDTKYIRLGFDKDGGIIGIMPMSKADNSAFEVNINTDKGWVRIYSKDFVRYVEVNNSNVDLTKTEKYMVEWNAELNMAIIDLNKKVKYNSNKNDEKEDEEDEQEEQND